MGLFRTGLDVVQRRDEFRHVLKERRDDRAWERKQEENEQRREDRARELRIKMAAQRQTAAQKAEEARQREAARAEKEVKSRPRTRYAGGTCKDDRLLAQPIMVHHHKADEAVVAILTPPGSGEPPLISAASFRMKSDPDIRDDAEWVETVGKPLHRLFKDVDTRYGGLLSKLRDHTWWRGVCLGAGVAMSHTYDESWKGKFSTGTRRVTEHVLPTVNAVRVAEDGLRIRISHRTGDTAKNWAKSIDALRASFKAAGAPAGRLRVVEDKQSNIVLIFDDAPAAFPKAIAPPAPTIVHNADEARKNYREFRWPVGVDSRGTVIAPPISEVYHVLAAGGTGSGKSVWLRGVIEAARLAGFRVYLGDGKMSDYPALETAPGVVMRSSDAPQHVVLVAEVHDELVRRQAVAEQRKVSGHPDPFDFDPLLIVLDEFASMRSDVLGLCGGKDSTMTPWLNAIAAIARKGREVKVHLVLASQDLYVENIPNQWQSNFQMLVSLGAATDKTLSTDFLKDYAEEASRIGKRITRKQRGRALFVDKEKGFVREIQTFYAYSPGTTSLDPEADPDTAPPTAEVRSAWEAQTQAIAHAPRLYPRVGIKADDPSWAELDLKELMKVDTVALDDAAGNPLPAMVRYDHRRFEWPGRPRADLGTQRGSAAGTDEPAVPSAPSPAPLPTAQPQPVTHTPIAIDSLNEEQRAELLRQLLGTPVAEADAETAPQAVSAFDIAPQAETPKRPEPKSLPTTEPPAAVGGVIGDL